MKTYRVVVVEETEEVVEPGRPFVSLAVTSIDRRVVAEGPIVPEDSIPAVARLLRQIVPVLRVGATFRRALTTVTTNLKGNT